MNLKTSRASSNIRKVSSKTEHGQGGDVGLLKVESKIQYAPHQPHQASMSFKTSFASSSIRIVGSTIHHGQGGEAGFDIESEE